MWIATENGLFQYSYSHFEEFGRGEGFMEPAVYSLLVGKENYTWYEQNLHLIPYTWDQQVTLLERELERAQASLLLEEHNNRNLPPLKPAADAATFNAMTQARLDKFVNFLVKGEIIP